MMNEEKVHQLVWGACFGEKTRAEMAEGLTEEEWICAMLCEEYLVGAGGEEEKKAILKAAEDAGPTGKETFKRYLKACGDKVDRLLEEMG